MKTPDQKYYHDPAYHRMVDMMVQAIREFQFTPSEIREMAMLAAIKYESLYPRPIYMRGSEVNTESLSMVPKKPGDPFP